MAAENPGTLNRRQALTSATLTFGALWGALAVPSRAAAQATLAWTPQGLTASQARTLEVAAELIMPATDTPGAREAGVPQFVDRAVATFCDPAQAQAIRGGLDRMDSDARAAHGAAFVAITPVQQAALLTRYQSEAKTPRATAPVGRGDTETGLSNTAAATPAPQGPPFFPILRDLVTVGYFTSEIGAKKAVRYDPNPGAYRGCVPLKEIGRAWAT